MMCSEQTATKLVRIGWDGMGWDGMGWDGMGWDGMGWDRIGTIRRAKYEDAVKIVNAVKIVKYKIK